MKKQVRDNRFKIKMILAFVAIFLSGYFYYIGAQIYGSISGTVYDKEINTPLANATVIAFTADLNSGHSTSTNELGQFTVGNLTSGVYQMSVDKEGYSKDIQKQVSLNEGQTLQNIIIGLPKEGRIVGKVTKEDGTALSGIEVWAYQEVDTSFGNAKTDATGTYKIKGLAEGYFNVSIRAEAFVSQIRKDVLVRSTQATTGIDFVLVLGGSIQGRVTDEEGRALEGAEISVTRREDQSGVGITETLLDGTYQIKNLLTGSYDLLISKDGYVSLEQTNISVFSGQETKNIHFTLTKTGSISGKVIYSDGTPIAGAQVFAGEVPAKAGESTTGPDGFYEIRSLPVGNYHVAVFVKGHQAPFLKENITVEEGKITQNTDFILPSTSSIRGFIYQGNETNPLSEVFVAVTNLETGATFHEKSTSKGEYILENVPSGTYSASFAKDGFPNVELIKVQVNQNSSTQFNIVMGEGEISGRVTLSDSITPVNRAFVIASAIAPFIDVEFTFTDSEGKYKIDNLLATKYEVVAGKDGFRSATLKDVSVFAGQTSDNINLSVEPK